MEKLKSLVRSAINFNETRGDSVEVVNMRFAQADAGIASGAESDMIMGMPKIDLLRIAETLMLAFIGLMVVLLVVRPILRRLFESSGVSESAGAGLLAQNPLAPQAQLPAPGTSSFARELEDEASDESEIEKMIDISRVEGRVKASSLRKVGEIVEKHPEEAVSILRNWINQENR